MALAVRSRVRCVFVSVCDWSTNWGLHWWRPALYAADWQLCPWIGIRRIVSGSSVWNGDGFVFVRADLRRRNLKKTREGKRRCGVVFCVCNNPQSLGFFVASDSGETTRQSLGGSTLVALGTLSVVSIIPLTGQRPLRWDWTHSFLAGPIDLLTYFSPVAILRLLFQKKGRNVRR